MYVIYKTVNGTKWYLRENARFSTDKNNAATFEERVAQKLCKVNFEYKYTTL